MSLLGLMSTLIILGFGTFAPFLVIGVVIFWAVACAYIALQNEYAKPLLKQGWTPLLGAMVITSGSGIVLDLFVSRYEGYALLAVAFGGAYLTSTMRRIYSRWLCFSAQAFLVALALFSYPAFRRLGMWPRQVSAAKRHSIPRAFSTPEAVIHARGLVLAPSCSYCYSLLSPSGLSIFSFFA